MKKWLIHKKKSDGGDPEMSQGVNMKTEAAQAEPQSDGVPGGFFFGGPPSMPSQNNDDLTFGDLESTTLLPYLMGNMSSNNSPTFGERRLSVSSSSHENPISGAVSVASSSPASLTIMTNESGGVSSSEDRSNSNATSSDSNSKGLSSEPSFSSFIANLPSRSTSFIADLPTRSSGSLPSSQSKPGNLAMPQLASHFGSSGLAASATGSEEMNSQQPTELEPGMKWTDAAPIPSGVPSGTAMTEAGIKKGFHINTSLIQATTMTDQSAELAALGLDVFNQDQFEQGIMEQVDFAIEAEEKERREKILTKELKAVTDDVRTVRGELMNIDKVLAMLKPKPGSGNKEIERKIEAVKRQKENKLKQLKKLKAKEKSLKRKLHGNEAVQDDDDDMFDDNDNGALEQALGLMADNETEQERMIRMGEMTPFGTVVKKPDKPKPPAIKPSSSEMTDFEKFLMGQDGKKTEKKPQVKPKKSVSTSGKEKSKSGKIKRSNSEDMWNIKTKQSAEDVEREKRLTDIAKGRQREHKRKCEDDLGPKRKKNFFDEKSGRTYRTEADFSNWQSRTPGYKVDHEFRGDGEMSDYGEGSEDDYRPSRDECIDDSDGGFSSGDDAPPRKKFKFKKKKSKRSNLPKEFHGSGSEVEEVVEEPEEASVSDIRRQYNKGHKRTRDDGDQLAYEKRLSKFQKEELKRKHQQIISGEDRDDDEEVSDAEFDGGFKVPGRIWNRLYRYQKTCVRWLWELHWQGAGGIVGDEMGLGKTIQTIAFLAGLKTSKLRDKGSGYIGCGPVIIICPTTVMHQWVKEFHTWWPPFRIAVLHSSGSFTSSESELVRDIVKKQGILVTSYGSMLIHQDTILKYNWHYVVLDEGHKIRNPDAQITLACKQFRTPHRFILSGSPLQNNLKELWSLFDFVFPGKLSTLPEFMTHFSIPITQGGYTNATQVQVQTAYKCACVLRDTINPYLLRRMKADVQTNIHLPNKSEQVLFCRLTTDQKEVYQEYIDSRECQQILSGNFMVFPGLITLRKICNHPDLSTGGPRNFDFEKTFKDDDPSTLYGYWKRSGKMIVVKSLLKIWKQQGHRVLLFSQSKQMLDILEKFVQNEGYSYMRMDGGTPIGARQAMINYYNETPSIFVYILTTRVGGLGVNLTGANRVIIFDPDWNPSTDMQARERAWRIGQTKQVTIYRLLTAGTIEEKIYHRQIFKQFLANRVLKDPKQRRFFKSNDLYELFTLGSQENRHGTETHALFAGTGSKIDIKPSLKKEEGAEKVKKPKNRFDALRSRQPKKEAESEDEAESLGSIKNSVKGKFKGKKNGTTKKSKSDKNSTEDVEYDDDDMPKVAEDKLAWMKELAKKLSQKISSGDLKSEKTVSPKPSTSREVKNGHHSNSDSRRGDSDSRCGNSDSRHGNTDSRRGNSDKHRDQKEKDREHRKKKKRKQKDAVFEGERIENLVSHGEWKQQKDEDDEDKNKQDNDFVLASLFKKSGVHSAMQHDVIMDSSSPDYALVEGEAERVAKEAAKALKVSKKLTKHAAYSGVPTWTGHSGQTGLPKSKPRFGQKKNSLLMPNVTPEKQEKPKDEPKEKLFNGEHSGLTVSVTLSSSPKKPAFSSSQLLQRMQQRNYGTKSGSDVSDDEHNGQGELPTIVTEHSQLITDMRNFIAFRVSSSYHATTRELLDEFGHRLPPQDSAKFKAMLHQICTFEKQNNIGVWSLKADFR